MSPQRAKSSLLASGKRRPASRSAAPEAKRDLTGKRFGRLTVTECLGSRKSPSGKSVKTMWRVVCKCGSTKAISGHSLTRSHGATRSCGCINEEKKWTKEKLIQLVKHKNILNLMDLEKRYPGAHTALRTRFPKLIDSLFPDRRVYRYSEDQLRKTLTRSKAKSVADFNRNHSSEYQAILARHRHLLEEFFPNRTRPHTRESVRKHLTAAKYKSVSDWEKRSRGTYTAARRRFPDLISEFFPDRKRTLTQNEIEAEAKKYQTRGEFQKRAPRYYQAAYVQNLLARVCSHMRPATKNFGRRYIYAYEFEDKTVYVGLTIDREKRHYDHINEERSPVHKKLNQGIRYKLKYLNEGRPYSHLQAPRKEAQALEGYRGKGWIILNRARAGALGSVRRIWTHDKILTEAKKYRRKVDFQRQSKGAYMAALRLGLLDDHEMFGHMIDHHKRVKCVETGREFASIAEASRHMKVNGSAISRACRGLQKTSGGCHWIFLN